LRVVSELSVVSAQREDSLDLAQDRSRQMCMQPAMQLLREVQVVLVEMPVQQEQAVRELSAQRV
jgi:hypothetical protein